MNEKLIYKVVSRYIMNPWRDLICASCDQWTPWRRSNIDPLSVSNGVRLHPRSVKYLDWVFYYFKLSVQWDTVRFDWPYARYQERILWGCVRTWHSCRPVQNAAHFNILIMWYLTETFHVPSRHRTVIHCERCHDVTSIFLSFGFAMQHINTSSWDGVSREVRVD